MNKYEVKTTDIFPVEGPKLSSWVYIYKADEADARIAELVKFIREITHRSPETNQILTVKADVTQMMRDIGLAD